MKTGLAVTGAMKPWGAARWWMAIVGVLLLAGAVEPVLARRAITADAALEGPKEWPANTNRHTVSIVRPARDDAGRALIARAEGLLPDRAEVAKASGNLPEAADARIWWFREQFGIRVPYAVTGDAVVYYAGLVTGYGKARMKRHAEPSSLLKYTATVTPHEGFGIDGKTWNNVRVVTLKLEFRQSFCASGTEAFGFTKLRTVVFDAQGKVLHVSGDGATEVPVMAI